MLKNTVTAQTQSQYWTSQCFDTPNRLDYYFKQNNGFVHGE